MDCINNNSSIILVSSDSRRISIKYKAAKRSKFIKHFVKDFPGQEIHFQNIVYSTLLKIKEYLEFYQDKKPKKIEMPLPKKDFKECVDEFDYNYINIDTEKIFEIMLAANFMDIKYLLDLTSAKIASILKGKSPSEIRRVLNMDKDIDELDEIGNNKNIENLVD